MKPASDILKILSKKAGKTLWILGQNAFAVILLVIFLEFIFCGFIIYKNVILVEKQELKAVENILRFDTAKYQSVLKELQSREQENSAQ